MTKPFKFWKAMAARTPAEIFSCRTAPRPRWAPARFLKSRPNSLILLPNELSVLLIKVREQVQQQRATLQLQGWRVPTRGSQLNEYHVPNSPSTTPPLAITKLRHTLSTLSGGLCELCRKPLVTPVLDSLLSAHLIHGSRLVSNHSRYRYCEAMCEAGLMQVVCQECHAAKTHAELSAVTLLNAGAYDLRLLGLPTDYLHQGEVVGRSHYRKRKRIKPADVAALASRLLARALRVSTVCPHHWCTQYVCPTGYGRLLEIGCARCMAKLVGKAAAELTLTSPSRFIPKYTGPGRRRVLHHHKRFDNDVRFSYRLWNI